MIIKTTTKQRKRANESRVKNSFTQAVREDLKMIFPWESSDGLVHLNLHGHRMAVFA